MKCLKVMISKKGQISYYGNRSKCPGYLQRWEVKKVLQSDLVYPYSLVLFGHCSDCETYGLLNHFTQKMVEKVYGKYVQINEV